MLGREALVVLSQLRQVMAEKRGELNEHIAIAVVRLYSRMIRGDWLPSPLQEQEPDWDPESGTGIAA